METMDHLTIKKGDVCNIRLRYKREESYIVHDICPDDNFMLVIKLKGYMPCIYRIDISDVDSIVKTSSYSEEYHKLLYTYKDQPINLCLDTSLLMRQGHYYAFEIKDDMSILLFDSIDLENNTMTLHSVHLKEKIPYSLYDVSIL